MPRHYSRFVGREKSMGPGMMHSGGMGAQTAEGRGMAPRGKRKKRRKARPVERY